MWNPYSAMDLTFFVEVLSSFNVETFFNETIEFKIGEVFV